MPAVRRGYRLLIGLYPADFRHAYGADLAMIFDDLVADHGVLAAVRRTLPDLLLTIVRYRLEAAMQELRTTQLIISTAIVLVLGTLTFPLFGVGLASQAAPLLILGAVALLVTQRHRLARAIRDDGAPTRRRRFGYAAGCLVVLVTATASWLAVISDGRSSSTGLTLPPLVAVAALLLGAWFLCAALLTPRNRVTAG